MSIQSRLLYLTSTVFAAMVLVLASVSPAAAGETTHCCVTKLGCENNTQFHCQFGPSCTDVDWLAECKGGEEN